jgi:phytoene/squalene synthetase
MEMTLVKQNTTATVTKKYLGSAEVVGLMCLFVFCEGDKNMYNDLKPSAQALGAAFQKVNFLRDVKADYEQLNRSYFPEVDFTNFTPRMKQEIEADIAVDFENAYEGILNLPAKARFGVYVAYKYYLSLFKKIKRTARKYPGNGYAYQITAKPIRCQSMIKKSVEFILTNKMDVICR